MTTTPPDGIYYIEVVGSGQPQYLTREKGSDAAVTILPPSAKPDPAQEVMCCFLMSTIVCCSPAILVESPQR